MSKQLNQSQVKNLETDITQIKSNIQNVNTKQATQDIILSLKADLVNGLVPSSQLPAFVDEIIEVNNFSDLPAFGDSSKIYLVLSENKQYRWSGSQYVGIDNSIAIGETESTAYRGDRGKIAYDHSQIIGNPHNTSKNDIGLNNVDNTSDVDKPISNLTQIVLNLKADKNDTYTKIEVDNALSTKQPSGTYLNSVTAGSNITISGTQTNPTINAGFTQLNSDWNSLSGVTQILNKPSIQPPITLTINGSFGPSTFTSNTLNIPAYTLSGLGGQPLLVSGTNIKTINGTSLLDSGDIITFQPSYGEIFKTGTPIAQTIPTGTTPTKITAFTNGGQILNMIPNIANSNITVQNSGIYRIDFNLSGVVGKNNLLWKFIIFKNGSAVSNLQTGQTWITAANTNNVSLSGIVSLASNDVIDVRCTQSDPASQTITPTTANVFITRVG